MEIAAFVVGLVGLILSLNVFTSVTGLLLGILAIVFGIIGIAKKDSADKGKAVAGLIMGIITLIIVVIIGILVGKAISYFADQLPKLIEEISQAFEEQMDNITSLMEDSIREMERESLSSLF